MTVTPGVDPTIPTPSVAQYEIYTQNGPMALSGGLYITENGKISVDPSQIEGAISGGTF